MIEFEEYLKLGNELEAENNILMACAIYLEAIKYSIGEQKQVIENYVNVLARKISNNNAERNRQVKQVLMDWKNKGKIAYAIKSVNNIYNDMDGINWLDSDNVILYRCFKVYHFEEEYGVVSLDIKNTEMEELKKWYYSLKFMIRRVDMNIYEENEIVEYIKSNNISAIAIYYISTTMCFHIDRACQNFVKMFANYGMKEYALFFENAYNQVEKSKEKEIDEYIWKTNTDAKEKIAFIIAVNEEWLYEEALYYINHLKVPEHMEVEVVPIRGASSATSAYNKGMKLTDAKYKVYMHQDVMIVNPYMIYEMMNIFQNKEIGMIGVAGTIKMPEDGIWWNSEERYMRILQDSLINREVSDLGMLADDYVVVEAIDGVMMVTQYDIEWREDIFTGWHFYDISQSMEFNRKNLKVVIAAQKEIWCLHEQKANKAYLKDYVIEREKYFREYKK